MLIVLPKKTQGIVDSIFIKTKRLVSASVPTV